MTSRGKFWGATGGARQNFGGAVAPLAPPWHPPSSAPASRSRSRSRLLWQSLGLGLVSKFEPGLGLEGYGLDYNTGRYAANTTLNFVFDPLE